MTAAQLRTAGGRLAARRRYLPLLATKGPVGYVGWVGEDNVGDEALYDAHRLLFPDAAFVPLPNLPPNGALRVMARARRPLLRALCIGGGTLIGNRHFRETVDGVLEVQPDAPHFLIGTGVEADTFVTGHRAAVHEELARWKPILEPMQPVRVRGPESVRVLEGLGLAAEVVGDPALLLRPPAGSGVIGTDEVLGLNIASVDELWGGDEEGVFGTLLRLGRWALGTGRRVLVLEASGADAPVSEALAAALGAGAEVVPAHAPEAFLRAVARCHVLVGERLHAVVLAAAAAVPAISLEYRPKALDFQRSIGREGYNVRTDRLDPDELTALTEGLWAERDRHGKEIEARVDELRSRLRAAAADIAATVLGAPAGAA